MSNSIVSQARSMWKSLTNASETATESKKLISNEPIDGTPFHLVGSEEVGYFISLGKYRLTEPSKKEEDALMKLSSEKWQIVARLVAAYIDFDTQMKNQQHETMEPNHTIDN